MSALRHPLPGAALARDPRRGWITASATATAALAVSALIALALGSLPLNLYDVSFTLDWGRDLVHGLVPDVRVVGASTPHPLSILSGAIAALFGGHALDAMRAVLLVSGGVSAVSLYRIGQRSCGVLVGVAAVLVLFSSEPFLFATLGQATPSDLPSLAALLAALAYEVARPRRGVAPLVLLSVAGLWRPEPWLVSGLYWLWASRGGGWRRRLGLGAIAASAPVLWMTGDLLMTGDPLYSLTYTHAVTELVQRPTGLTHVAGTLRATLVSYLGVPGLVTALAGVVLECFVRRLPRLILLLLVLTVVGFAAVGAAHLPLDDRYALPTTALLAVFFGFLVGGWWGLPRSPLRHAWMLGALVALGFTFATTPGQVRALATDHTTFRQQSAIIGDLQKLVHPALVRAELRACGPVQSPYRVLPILAYDIGERPRTLTATDEGIPPYGSFVLPRSTMAIQLFESHAYPAAALERHGYEPLVEDSSWSVYALCPHSLQPVRRPSPGPLFTALGPPGLLSASVRAPAVGSPRGARARSARAASSGRSPFPPPGA